MRFAVFTHVEHISRSGKLLAYAPYVREMNLWVRHVEEVEVVGTRRRGNGENGGLGDEGRRRLRENGIPYEHSELIFTEVPSFNFLNFSSAVKAIGKIPFIFFKIIGAMGRADHLHLRCPGNIGLLACICQIFFPFKPKSAKYAGNWDPEAKQPWTYRFQIWLLSNTFLTRNMQVLVYGKWPGQTKNIMPFFTASFSEKGKAEDREKTFLEKITFLYVGNLVEGKRPLEAIKLIEAINTFTAAKDQEIRASLEIYGDGPEKERLENYCSINGLEEQVSFKGSQPLEELKGAYQKAHFVVLPSKSEGWPKAIAEGMFYGCIPISTPVSCVPWMLNYGSRGVLLEEFGQQLKMSGKDIEIIIKLLADQEEMKRMSEAAKEWSQQYTLDRFEEAIKVVLSKGPQTKKHKGYSESTSTHR